MPQPEATFEEKMQGDRKLVICTVGEFQGAARVFSAGVDEAKDRAEAQARAKYVKANPE